jgi:predicted nucleic acid-binding protein
VLLVAISRRSKDYWVFQRFLDEEYTLCVTTEILLEYEEIIGRRVSRAAAEIVMEILVNAPNIELITRYYEWNLVAADPDDNKFVDCAVAAGAKFIVSEDGHFRALRKIAYPKVEVRTIEEFKAEFVV